MLFMSCPGVHAWSLNLSMVSVSFRRCILLIVMKVSALFVAEGDNLADAVAVARLVARALLEEGACPPRADGDGAGEPFAWVVPSSWRFLHGMPARHAHHASLYT